MEEFDPLQGAVQGLCTLIEKYDQHERAIAIKGVTPIFSGKLINYNLIKGIDINDSAKSIGTIYKRLALITHPDKGGNENDLTILNNAVEILRNGPDAINQVLMSLMQSQQTKRGDAQVELPFVQTSPSENYTAKMSPVDIPKTSAEDIMNDFIKMYIMFYQLRQLNASTSGEIDPYFYAKNQIEYTYPGVTILPFDGDNEETFNANINMYLSKIPGSQLPSFEGKFEVVKSYNVKRVATAKEKTDALARFDENIAKREALIGAPSGTRSSGTKKPRYNSSVVSSTQKFNTQKKTGGSKTKRNRTQKRNKPKTKRNRNKSKQKRSRKTRR